MTTPSTHHQAMSDLFAQLGLPDDSAEIRRFISQHRPLEADTRLADAPFWNAHQADFLRQMLKADSDWAVTIDQLDAALREHPTPADLPNADDDPPAAPAAGKTAARKPSPARL